MVGAQMVAGVPLHQNDRVASVNNKAMRITYLKRKKSKKEIGLLII